MISQGWDISPNHGAMVQLVDGVLDAYRFYTTVAADAVHQNGRRITLLKEKDRHRVGVQRLFDVQAILWDWMRETLPTHVALEDYAIRAEQGAHYLGEIGAVARMAIVVNGALLRLHDPTTVKMYAAHAGNAPKEDVQAAVVRRWNLSFGAFDKTKSSTAAGDLTDAFALAQLCWTEQRLRIGELRLSELPHPKEVQVFQRCTKMYPSALLDREWISGGAA
jgi:Holliday junction resolvasome RuvABC endonuclease subunit